jgi:peptidoglycan hydrolase CwlO-like protein
MSYVQYNTKGKNNGMLGAGGASITNLSENEDFRALQTTVISMQNAVSNASNVANRVKNMQNTLAELTERIPAIVSKMDTSASKVYSTKYINDTLAQIPIIHKVNDSAIANNDDVLTYKGIKTIPNITNIPTTKAEYADDNSSVYGCKYINDLASKIPTPMNADGVCEDVNPLMYTADYIDENIPLVCSSTDTVERSNNVYNTGFINKFVQQYDQNQVDLMERLGVIERKTTGNSDTISMISQTHSQKIDIIRSDQLIAQAEMESMSYNVSSALRDLNTMQTNISAIQQDLNNAQTNVQTSLNAVSKDITTIKQNQTGTQASLDGAIADVSMLKAQISAFQSQVSRLDASIANINTKIGTMQENINELLDRVSTLERLPNDLNNIVTTCAGLNDRLTMLENKVNEAA